MIAIFKTLYQYWTQNTERTRGYIKYFPFNRSPAVDAKVDKTEFLQQLQF